MRLAESLARFSEQWPGSVGFSFTLCPRVAELQGEDVGSFYLNILSKLDRCPARHLPWDPGGKSYLHLLFLKTVSFAWH